MVRKVLTEPESTQHDAAGDTSNEGSLENAGTEAVLEHEGALSAASEALNETEQASIMAEEALQAEGVAVKPLAHDRKTRTSEQMIRSARRQREYGRKLLQRRTGGFASVMQDVKLNNAVLAAAFERFFPIIDQCAYLVARHGASTLGEKTAEQILERIITTSSETLKDRKQDLAAAQAVIGEASVSMGSSFIEPQFTQPAYSGTVQIRTPHAMRVLDLFKVSDSILSEVETLYWNQMRSLSEKNDEALRAKRAVFPLFTFAASTIRNLHRRMRDRNDEISGTAEAIGAAPAAANESPGAAGAAAA